MRRNRKQTPCDQTSFLPRLAAAETERRALIRGALSALGFRADFATGLEALLMYLDAAAGDKGCRAYIATLKDKVGAGRRTVDRRLAVLREHRLIHTERSRPGGSCFNRLDWQRIRELAYRGNDDEPATEQQAHASHAPRETGSTVAASASDGGRRFGEATVATAAPRAVAESGATSRRSGATSRRSGAIILTNPANADSSPPAPREGPGTAWDRAASAVAAVGLGSWRSAVAAARANGLTPEDVLAIIAEWRRRLPLEGRRWNSPAGVLKHMLEHAHPDAIPRPEPAVPVAPAPRRQRDGQRDAEQRWGARLDALPAADRDRLAVAALAGSPALAMYRQDASSALARMLMLGYLDEHPEWE